MQTTNEIIIDFLKLSWKEILLACLVAVSTWILSIFFKADLAQQLFVTIPSLLFVYIFVRIYLKFRKYEFFISKGIQYNTESMLSIADEYLKSKASMTCLCCGGNNVNLKGITRFYIDATRRSLNGRAGLISAVIGCDDCGFIRQHNLPLALFDDEGKK